MLWQDNEAFLILLLNLQKVQIEGYCTIKAMMAFIVLPFYMCLSLTTQVHQLELDVRFVGFK